MGAQPPRHPKLKPILRPGASKWALLWCLPPPPEATSMYVLGIVVMVVGGALAIPFAVAGLPILAAVFVFGPMAALMAATVRSRTDVVGPPAWAYEGRRLNDTVLDILEDIQTRFEYARSLVGQVPTGIDWAEVAPHVGVLLWECLGHAAQVTVLDAELYDLRYAAAGTPQAVLLHKVEARRAEHWLALVEVQREADSLARVAGNAAAAAKVALARTGDVRLLEAMAPSTRAIMAKGALDQARERLSMLADAWTELDESGDLLAEKLRLEKPE